MLKTSISTSTRISNSCVILRLISSHQRPMSCIRLRDQLQRQSVPRRYNGPTGSPSSCQESEIRKQKPRKFDTRGRDREGDIIILRGLGRCVPGRWNGSGWTAGLQAGGVLGHGDEVIDRHEWFSFSWVWCISPEMELVEVPR